MTTKTSSSASSAPSLKGIPFQRIQTASVLILLIVLCLYSAIRTPTFFTWANLVDNLLANAACLGIIACGMTFVMIAGGFDLSVASATALCSVTTVLLLQGTAGLGAGPAIALAILGTLAAGAALGALNGVLVAYVGVNPFVVTLSTMLIFRGVALIVTHGGLSITVPLSVSGAFRQMYWGKASFWGSATHAVACPILVFAVVFVVCHYVLRLTRFGRYIYAVGGNENASWLAGVNTPLVKTVTYTICGLTCAIAAVIYSAMSVTAQAASYQGLEMMVIASVIVGGTPLGGGSGNLFYTLNGLLLLSVIENLLAHFGVTEEYRNVVRGLIILVVVTVDVLVRRSRQTARR